MRFLYVGAFRLPNLDAAAPRVITIGKMLRDSGHEVKYISWGGEYDKNSMSQGKYYVDGFEYVISDELKIIRNPLKRFSQWVRRGRNSLAMIKNRDDYDAIIAYQPSLYFIEQLKKLCRKKGKKLIVDITEWYDNKELRFIDRPLQYYNMTVALKGVRNKILISSHLDYYYQGTNNVIIPATCDLEDAKWKESNAVRFSDFNGISLIYAGTPTLKDKLYVAVQAVTRLIQEGEKIRFYIFGVTKGQYLKGRPGEIPEEIIFMGRVNQNDIPGYYQQSDFMLLLRDRTRKNMMGFPTKFAEAVTSGIPIISNNTSDLPKYLKHGVNGFLIEEPTEECLYEFMKGVVCKLSTSELNKLKATSRSLKAQLDYRAFEKSLDNFIKKLS